MNAVLFFRDDALKGKGRMEAVCHDYINEYIRKTMGESSGLLKELEAYAAEHHIPVVQPEIARLLLVLGSMQKPARILEIGTAIGYSAILLADILQPGGRIDTIERDEQKAEQAVQNIKKAGKNDVIRVIVGEAEEILCCLEKKYDMIFLDAAKGQYPEFLPECLRLLRPGGLMATDNVLYHGMVACDDLMAKKQKTLVLRLREYLDRLCSHPELTTSILPVGDGVALSYRK